MYILGISAFYHDSAACLLKDGEIIAAAQEERFTRKKHDPRFPKNAVEFCLKTAGITPAQINITAFYDKPFLKFERLIESYLMYAPVGIKSFMEAMPAWVKLKLYLPSVIREELEGFQGKIVFPEHHESHSASAFYPSPFEEAAILTIDGVGEWTTTSFGTGAGNNIKFLKQIRFPHSLGLLYSAFTYYTGFKVNSGEYKVMGLAPYGEPKYVDTILNNLIDLKEDGSFKLDMRYFNYCAGLTMTNSKFDTLFGGPPRKPESSFTQREMDLAKSVQVVTEMAMLRMAKHIRKETGMKNLCLAGGVALNCVGNGAIDREGIFENIWIQPAAGDAGGAIGSALVAWHKYLGKPRKVLPGDDLQKGSYLGPDYTDPEIESFLVANKCVYSKLGADTLPKKVAEVISQGNVVGWFHGRMEFGPRALGARSIIGDARNREMQSVMNLKIKFRESFRPFAPSLLEEKSAKYFHSRSKSPYMLLVAPVREEHRIEMTQEQEKLFGIAKLNIPRSNMPAITHVDYSARLQTVDGKWNPMYRRMIEEFDKITGCPVIINTSFNVRGEPIVCRPEEAYKCFMRTNMDYLVLGNYLLKKEDQPKMESDTDWQKEFELD